MHHKVLLLAIFSISLLNLNAEATACTRNASNLTANYEASVLTSPNFPNTHPNGLDCWWTIRSRDNISIMFTIQQMDTEACCDYLVVYDGPNKMGDYRGTFNNNLLLISTTTEMRINFISDSSVAKAGFEATFKQVHNCGYRLTASKTIGHFTTPYYPKPHPPNLDCFWTIVAQNPNERVAVTIVSGTTDSCCDYIEVFDGSRSVERLKGNLTQRTLSSTDDRLSIYFHSDGSINSDGFHATYKQYECGGSYRLRDDKPITISSPNYPNATGHDLNCTFSFQTDIGYRIEMDVVVNTEKCCDYIKVSEANKTLGTLRGDIPKSTIVTSGSNLRLNFHTDGSVKSKGFSGAVKRVLKKCGEVFHATFLLKTLTSPGYPRNYPPSFNCDYRITVPSGSQILFTLNSFVTETCCDYVEIFDGLISMGQLRGAVTQAIYLVTQSNALRLRFVTDDSTQKQGFFARYKQVNNCGYERTATSQPGTISTPLYPQEYHDNMDCMWVIRSSDDTSIQFSLNRGETEKGHDFLQIMDGLTPVASKLSGVLNPLNISTAGPTLRVYFHSDRSATREGFTSKYFQICRYQYNVTSDTQFIISPNYPGKTPHHYSCVYSLNASPGQRIKLTVLNFNTERCCDYVKLYDGNDKQNVLQTLKGTVRSGQEFDSTTTTMLIEYVTDGSVQSGGFQFSYTLAKS